MIDYVKLKDTKEGMIKWITKWVIPTVNDEWKSIYNEYIDKLVGDHIQLFIDSMYPHENDNNYNEPFIFNQGF